MNAAVFNLEMTHPVTGIRYILNAPAAASFLREAEACGDDCSESFKRFREDLRNSLTKEGLLDAEGEFEIQIAASVSFVPSVVPES